MGLFGRPTSPKPDLHEQVIALERIVLDLQRELKAATREVEQVDLHARAVAEECKRLINKFERRLDREAPPNGKEGPQEPAGRTNGAQPYLGPSRRNY